MIVSGRKRTVFFRRQLKQIETFQIMIVSGILAIRERLKRRQKTLRDA